MKLRLRRHPRRRRRGTVIVIMVIFMIPLLAIMAISLDGGLLMGERRRAQAAADASAYAAAGSLYRNYQTNHGSDPSNTAKNLALAIASGNGYANDGTSSTVTVNIPPLSGSFQGQNGYAEVVVAYNAQKCFSAIWGSGTMPATARTVARGKTRYNFGVILLNPTMSAALSGTGSARLNVPNGKIAVDSNSGQAAKFTGSAGATGNPTNITGGISGGTMVGPVNTGVPPTPDPLTGLAAPDMNTLTVQRTSQLSISTGQTMTISPGVYTGGISMSGGSLTLQPGIYYINGGGITTNSSASISGSGVFIYNGGSTVGSIKLTGSSSFNITPMTSGTWAGISIFQQRSSTTSMILTGSGGINITGGIYAASAPTTLSGSTSTNVTGSFLIADSALLTGSSSINVGTGAATGLRDLRIVERGLEHSDCTVQSRDRPHLASGHGFDASSVQEATAQLIARAPSGCAR